MSNLLIKKTNLEVEKVFPKTYIHNITDKKSNKTLELILNSFNMYFLSYTGNVSTTRCLVPMILRKKGLWITYVKYDGNVCTEWYAASDIDDESWGDSSNWRIGNNTLVGDITISANGNWIINGTETEFKAIGEKGNTPLIRIANNRLLVSYDLGDTYSNVTENPVYTQFRFNSLTNTYQVSYDLGSTWLDVSDEKVYYKFRYNGETNTHLVSTDLGQNWTDVSSNKVYYQFRTNDNRLLVSTDLGTTWENCSEPIAAWFRWADTSGTGNVGKVLISRDLLNWEDLSPVMTNNLYIKGYVSTIGNLPSSANIGDIYMVGPTYDESDTTHDYPHYRMWVKLSSGWVDNGEFTNAGPVNTSNIINGAVTIEKLDDRAIDNEPTTGSNNLVKSGGVKQELDKLDNKIGLKNYSGTLPADSSANKYLSFDGSYELSLNTNITVIVNSSSDNDNGNGWRLQVKPVGSSEYVYLTMKPREVHHLDSKVDCILVFHKPNYGEGSINFTIKQGLEREIEDVEKRLNTQNELQSIFNVNSLYPNDQSRTFTLESAVAAVPQEQRRIAKIICYRTDDGVEIAAFNSIAYLSGFENISNWNIISKGDNVYYDLYQTLYYSDNILTSGTVTLGAGWSGDISSGFVHTKGNDELLTIQTGIGWGRYLLKVTRLSGILSVDNGLDVKIGSSPYIDVYNGEDTMYIYYGGAGAVDASTIILKPSKEITFGVRIELFYIQTKETGTNHVQLTMKNVSHSQMTWNKTGFWNIVLGQAMENNQSGTRNIVLGHAAMSSFVSGTRNIAIGTFAASFIRSGDRNIAIGADSLYMIKEASDVIAIGKAAFGIGTVEGTHKAFKCVAIGTDTFKGQKAGSTIEKSIAIGYGAGYNSGNENICIGANADMPSQDIENSIVIGNNREALGDNEVWLGNKNTKTIVLGNRKLIFNEDGTVTWEYSKTRKTYRGSAPASESYNQYLSFDGVDSISIGKPFRFIVTSMSESIQDANGWRLEIHIKNGNVIYEPLTSNYDKTFESQCDYIKIWHKSGTGSGNIGFIVETEDSTELVV